jgi:magnesium chelatase family protein
MMARRITGILPDLTFDEALEITKIHSVAGKIENNTIITERPFRSPHHTISSTGLIGGGSFPKPGEISLSHYGVLFLDELPEFNKRTIEVLRGPLEDRNVTISRANASYSYPCNFMLVASMNPCPCGYYGSTEKECTCSEKQRSLYRGKISGPILDRIDIQIEVPTVKYEKLEGRSGESSAQIRERVNNARQIQLKRYKGLNIYSNADLSPKLIEKVCKLNEPSKIILKNAFEKMNLSARAYSRILKVARTIADLDGKKDIDSTHVIEAIGYRSLDRK